MLAPLIIRMRIMSKHNIIYASDLDCAFFVANKTGAKSTITGQRKQSSVHPLILDQCPNTCSTIHYEA